MFSHLTGLMEAFGNSPNPQYLFPAHTHTAALGVLSEVPEDGRNIRVLIGEPGTGKTTLLVHLLEQFGGSALTAHLVWTQLQRREFLHYFAQRLGVSLPAKNMAQAQAQLTQILEREFAQGRQVIVAIDEAHNLEISTLFGLAELLDGALARSKQLRVILAGLPRLADKLRRPEGRRIEERISAMPSLSPLTTDEVARYIAGRLQVFGYAGATPFTPDALTTVARLAGGIPRNINNICFAALYLAETRACDVIDSAMILDATAQWGAARPILAAGDAAIPAQESSSSGQQQVGATHDASNAPSCGEISANTLTASSGSDEAAATVSASIGEWFGEHRVAWSGTVGALAAALQLPEKAVAHALDENCEGLRSLRIGVSVGHSFGWTRSVSLRRLEPTQTEQRKPNLPEGEQEAGQGLNSTLRGPEDGPAPAKSSWRSLPG
jgi:type II secretory pathway predicted ATPase ExeA